MAINFHPKPAMVLMCDFDSGFVPPEMVKKRRVVIISPAQENKRGICSVVPLSTTVPASIERFHYKIEAGKYPFLSKASDIWVKADMIATISASRLDRIRLHNNQFVAPSLLPEDFAATMLCVKNYLHL